MPVVALVMIAVLMSASIAQAESPDASGYDTVRTSAKPIKRIAPRYPRVELSRNRQGWVDLNFVVTPEGKVIDPIVVDSSGSPAFERAAMAAVEQFEYEPATINGKAVQQCETKTRVTFAIDGPPGAVSRNFYRRYKKIEAALDERNLEEADELIDSAFEAKGTSMAENAWLWTARTRQYGMSKDYDRQLRAVRRATSNSSWVDESLYSSLLIIRTDLEIEKGYYAAAIQTYGLIDESGYSDANTEILRNQIDKIEDLVSSDRIISVSAEIEVCEECAANWRYEPLRRQFRIANVDGALDKLEIRCDWQRFTANIDSPGVQIWEMPPSWGDCSVFVFGEPGTTFDFYEVPSGYMSAN